MIGRIVAYIVGSMVAVLAVGTIFQDRFVTYESEVAVLTFGIVLGVLTAFVKPALKFISLPLTCLTFGLFALVINAALFGLAAALVRCTMARSQTSTTVTASYPRSAMSSTRASRKCRFVRRERRSVPCSVEGHKRGLGAETERRVAVDVVVPRVCIMNYVSAPVRCVQLCVCAVCAVCACVRCMRVPRY